MPLLSSVKKFIRKTEPSEYGLNINATNGMLSNLIIFLADNVAFAPHDDYSYSSHKSDLNIVLNNLRRNDTF